MSGAGRGLAAGLVGLALAAGISALTRVPYDPPASDSAVIRLSWRTPGDEVRECRTLTPQELAALPVHMQRPEVCDRRVLPRHLRAGVDGALVLDDTVRPTGARGDRPLYVYQEFVLAPGEHQLRVEFTRDSRATGKAEGGQSHPTVPSLELDTRLELSAGEVVLVTYDADRRQLVLRRSERAGIR